LRQGKGTLAWKMAWVKPWMTWTWKRHRFLRYCRNLRHFLDPFHSLC
jgi:hypothetical protein